VHDGNDTGQSGNGLRCDGVVNHVRTQEKVLTAARSEADGKKDG